MKGKVGIVTGATKGMGAAIAGRFASAGAKVTVSSRSGEDSAKIADDLNARYGAGEQIALAQKCDIEIKSDLEALVRATIPKWGRIDALVCSASTLPWFGPSLETPDNAVDQQF